MMLEELKKALDAGRYDRTFQKLYPGRAEGQRERYLRIAEEFGARFGEQRTVRLYSVPGRSEIGGNHTDLTDEYAAIPQEMKTVAKKLGADVLGKTSQTEFYAQLGALHGQVSDRALLRCMHFYGENDRVLAQVEALKKKDFRSFLELVRASGRSSMDLLQNIYPSGQPGERSVPLTLALYARLLEQDGAWRVHGGFASTVQAFVPVKQLDDFTRQMESMFGGGTCHILSIRHAGGIEVMPE